MKREYKKPEIMFESFEMSVNIAGDCEGIVGNPTKGSCAVLGSGGVDLFNSTISACDYTPEEMGQQADTYNGFCYHVPIDTNSLFNS